MVLHRQATSPEGFGEVLNFGESLSYWYFRINGFVPLVNFVLHRPDRPRRHNADADLLAVRFQHVFEEVGGQPEDWDTDTFRGWGLQEADHTVCVIAEVKTGRYSNADINRAFSQHRLHYGLRRIGVVGTEGCDEICEALHHAAVVPHGQFIFAKVLMSSTRFHLPGRDDVMTPCNHLQVEDALRFIRRRMRAYPQEKEAARMFFPGDLIQFLAWEANLPRQDQQNREDEQQCLW